jgi:Polymer-forming cytoskeletal
MKCRRAKSSRGARLRGPSRQGKIQPPATPTPDEPAPEQSPAPRVPADPVAVLRIEGQTEATIHYSGTVSVGPYGSVTGDVHAMAVVVEGAVRGHIHATERLSIAATATVLGDLHAPRVAVARGATVRGNITMRPVPPPPSDLDELAVDSLLTASRQA